MDFTQTSTLPAQPINEPSAFLLYRIDMDALESLLAGVPAEDAGLAQSALPILTIPMPDGSYQRFRVEESPILSPELQAQHPELHTFIGQGLDDRTATLRFDVTPAGFHAQVLAVDGAVIVDPYARGDTRHYMSFWKRDLSAAPGDFTCGVSGTGIDQMPLVPAAPSGSQLRTYRLAMTATGEYTTSFGGSAGALQQLMTSVNRVTGIYEVEVAIRLNLTATQIFTNPATDPFPNGQSVDGNLLNQNDSLLDANVGPPNYDVGHIVSQGGGGGLAGVGVVCGGDKGRGGTSRGTPSGDAFDVDYLAHELGHQYGGRHTFNDGATGSCGGGNRTGSSAYEPGSGSTIMAYAGICPSGNPSGGQNVQPNSDPYFHTHSFDQITAYREGGGNCGPQSATGNTPPTVNAGGDFTIPRNTPFKLTASGADTDGDALKYCWEQFDLGAASPPPNNADGPMFRSRNPTTSATRYFPQLATVLSGAADPWERLPTVNRTMNFRCTVRDNRANGGGVNYDGMVVTVSGAPFVVTAPNGGESLNGGCPTTVTWTVGGGSVATNVNILYSANGGTSWTTLVSNTANDGSESVTVPCATTSQGRIMVEAVGNIFYDVSNGNFSVVATPPTVAITVTGGAVDASCQRTVTFSGSVTDNCAVTAANVSVTVTMPGGGATLGVPTINKVQTDAQTVTITGSVLVSAILGPPVTVQVAVNATDDCGAAGSNSDTDTVFDNTPPIVTCPTDVTVECSAHCGTPSDDPQLTTFFAGFSATDNCDASPTLTNNALACFPLGTTTVTFTAEDNSSNTASCDADVTVVDTTPPVITVVLDRDVLWPPNHKLATVCATVTVTDICDPNPTWVLTSITSDEPDDGLGDGDTSNDIQDVSYGTADICVKLRSERAGGRDGRDYTLTYTASDASGNTATAVVHVRVPHDQSGHAIATTGFGDDGSGFAPGATQFVMVVPSVTRTIEASDTPDDEQANAPKRGRGDTPAGEELVFNATRVSGPQAYVGNGLGVVAPISTTYLDVDRDGFTDLVCLYEVADARALLDASRWEDGPLGLHYTVQGKLDYLVTDIFSLGTPRQLPEAATAWVAQVGRPVESAAATDAATLRPATPVTGTPPAVEERPRVTALTGVRPNPFQFTARVEFALARDGAIDLAVYDLRGARVRSLRTGWVAAGHHDASWDGTDDGGRRLEAGIYFIRYRATGQSFVRRVAMTR